MFLKESPDCCAENRLPGARMEVACTRQKQWGCEEWSDSGVILEVEPISCPDRLEVGCEREGGPGMNTRLGLSH